MKRRDRMVLLAVALAAGVLGFGLMAYIFSQRSNETAPAAVTQPAATPAAATAATPAQPATAPPQTPVAASDDSIFSHIFEPDPSAPTHPESWTAVILRIVWRFSLAAFLAALLAFRPRRRELISKRNPFVSQTQILLAVVASALMMIVGDSAARAFGIFAAVSLVRFRTNIRDPKEVTVLLISLAIGLATGVGRWELAVILCFFVLVLLWILEYREPEQVFRPMELRVKTRSVDQTQETLRETFKRHNLTTEVRVLNREDENDPLGCIAYHVDVSSLVSTDSLSEEIFSSDSQNIDSVEWVQQKSNTSIYQ